jgi:hypothetical protein
LWLGRRRSKHRQVRNLFGFLLYHLYQRGIWPRDRHIHSFWSTHACIFDARFIRNATGNNTITVRAVASSAGTPLAVDAGTPSIRLGGDWDMSFDGALLDATVANHAAGAGFYNTNAAFGAPGAGKYVRGSAAWVRTAA